MLNELQLQPLTTGRRAHLCVARALRARDPEAGAGAEPPGPVRDCLLRAARSDTYRALLIHGCHVEDSFEAFGYYTGVIDAWYETGQNAVAVVDWKTGEAHPAAHRLQRVLYALALLSHYAHVRTTTVNIGPYPWPDARETFTQADLPRLHLQLDRLLHPN